MENYALIIKKNTNVACCFDLIRHEKYFKSKVIYLLCVGIDAQESCLKHSLELASTLNITAAMCKHTSPNPKNIRARIFILILKYDVKM